LLRLYRAKTEMLVRGGRRLLVRPRLSKRNIKSTSAPAAPAAERYVDACCATSSVIA
jgi:hypothetical protein